MCYNSTMKEIIPTHIKQILITLTSAGHEAYLVGGAVRDFLMGSTEATKDFDIVTSSTPEQVCSIFGSSTTCGNNFLVALVDGDTEVATFRTDKEDCAEVAHTLYEDVQRRDFTINALAFDLDKNIFVDYVGGMEDLSSKTLRFVGNADRRIREDASRILRGIRFASKYNLEIEKETFFAMFRNRNLIKELPTERVQLEVVKAFKHSNTHRFLTLLREMEMLELVFPSLIKLEGKDGGGYHLEQVLNHCFNAVKALDDTNNVNLKLAALYHDIGKYRHTINEKGHICFKCHNLHGHDFIKNDLFKHLKFPKETVDYVIGMTELHMSCLDTRKAIKRLLVKLTEKDINVRDLLLLRYADKKSNMLRENTTFNATWSKYKEVLKIVNEKAPMRVKELEISGIDIIEYFKLKPSPEIGRLLKIAFDAVTNEIISNDKEEILEYLKNEM